MVAGVDPRPRSLDGRAGAATESGHVQGAPIILDRGSDGRRTTIRVVEAWPAAVPEMPNSSCTVGIGVGAAPADVGTPTTRAAPTLASATPPDRHQQGFAPAPTAGRGGAPGHPVDVGT